MLVRTQCQCSHLGVPAGHPRPAPYAPGDQAHQRPDPLVLHSQGPSIIPSAGTRENASIFNQNSFMDSTLYNLIYFDYNFALP